jgi:L-ascorbate 6-phosphate lactonase
MTGEPQMMWLGQAGFALFGRTTTVLFDPYLSDLCDEQYGLRRRVAAPLSPSQLHADVVLVSHWHEDHLDLDSAEEFVTGGAVFVAPPSCVDRLLARGIDPGALIAIVEGQIVRLGTTTITAVPALHRVPEAVTRDAVGFVLELDGKRIYHSGDSEYTRGMLASLDGGELDLALLCINGTGGNMDAEEAAFLASRISPRLVAPMHFGMWDRGGYGADATLDPLQFSDSYERFSPGSPVHIPELGKRFPLG